MKELDYATAVRLSYEDWSAKAEGKDPNRENYVVYGEPMNECWLCEWDTRNEVSCTDCVLKSCSGGSLFRKYLNSYLTGDMDMAKVYAEDIKNVLKHELDRSQK